MKDYLLTIYRPVESFNRLLAKPNYFSLGFLYILIPIAGYTLMYIFLTIGNGAPSVFTPWLNIPKDDYYAVNRFLLAPSMIMCWVVATSCIQILARLAGGKGSFEQTLAAIALSVSVAMWGGLFSVLPRIRHVLYRRGACGAQTGMGKELCDRSDGFCPVSACFFDF